MTGLQPQPQPHPKAPSRPGPANPVPADGLEPDVNIAITATGAFGRDSPMHQWILHQDEAELAESRARKKGKQQLTSGSSDLTESEIIKTVRRILRNQNAGRFDWMPAPNNKSYIRIDASIWVGMPSAPGNWRRCSHGTGWRVPKGGERVEHIGDPKHCLACKREEAEYIAEGSGRPTSARAQPRGTGSGRATVRGRGSRARARGRGGKGRGATPPSPGIPSSAPIGPQPQPQPQPQLQPYGECMPAQLHNPNARVFETGVAGPANPGLGAGVLNLYTNGPSYPSACLASNRPSPTAIQSGDSLKFYIDYGHYSGEGSSANIANFAGPAGPAGPGASATTVAGAVDASAHLEPKTEAIVGDGDHDNYPANTAANTAADTAADTTSANVASDSPCTRCLYTPKGSPAPPGTTATTGCVTQRAASGALEPPHADVAPQTSAAQVHEAAQTMEGWPAGPLFNTHEFGQNDEWFLDFTDLDAEYYGPSSSNDQFWGDLEQGHWQGQGQDIASPRPDDG